LNVDPGLIEWEAEGLRAALPMPDREASVEASTVLSWRAFIGEGPLDIVSRALASNGFLRRHWVPTEIASSSNSLSRIYARAIANPGVYSEKF
jgi:hypothetical protein